MGIRFALFFISDNSVGCSVYFHCKVRSICLHFVMLISLDDHCLHFRGVTKW
jgi:hypothetical protein